MERQENVPSRHGRELRSRLTFLEDGQEGMAKASEYVPCL
jgi:hypothetical protein